MKKTYMTPSMREHRILGPLVMLDASQTTIPVVQGEPTEWGAREDGFEDDFDEEDDY